MTTLTGLRLRPATPQIGTQLAELRARAMKPSLTALGRYDEIRVRARFLDGYSAEHTTLVLLGADLVDFFVLRPGEDHLLLDHLYVAPSSQAMGVGSFVMQHVIARSQDTMLPVRLMALKDSPANGFYRRHGFLRTGDAEFDNYYERHPT